uniref:Uncharacterized protein n=1 Tax=Cebus imitator TaxID=2715852 RepID=A0A2K5SDS5_CEBIM
AQPAPGSVCPWVSFNLLEPSVLICQMTRMLACFEEIPSGREHPGDTHISAASAQKPPSWISFIFTGEETQASWRLTNSPRVSLSSPCHAPSECSDMVQKHYR